MNFGEIWDKFELYIMSLWFLFLLIIVVTVDIPMCFGDNFQCMSLGAAAEKNIVPIISLSLVLFGIFFYSRFNYRIKGSAELSVEIIEIEDLNYEPLTFLTTYIIPLVCLNLESPRYLIVLIFLLIVIGVIYVKTDKFYANPTLAVLGFKLYKVTLKTRTGKKENIVVITKDKLSEKILLKTLYLDEKVCFARKIE